MTNIPSDQPPGPRVSETRARAGFKDKPVLWVLVASLALAVIFVMGAMLWRPDKLESMDADTGRDRRDAELFDQTPQAPKGD
jgi:hypothetical protein